MLSVFERWYQRKFSDPDAVMLLILILVSALVLTLWGEILTPLLVALVVAYLLDWPVVKVSQWGVSRGIAATLILVLFLGLSAMTFIGLVPVVVQQGTNLVNEMPQIWGQGEAWIMTLPEKYPTIADKQQIETVLQTFNDKIVGVGESVITASLGSLLSLAALMIYCILVPLMVFFMLKDKEELLHHFSRLLPEQRRLIKQVGTEMNQQISNYIRGKVIEIIIVGSVSAITFALMDLRYPLLLGILVGFSVLIPYIGAAVVTLPVAAVALFQWGISPDFWYILIAYGVIQALDGNALVPVLFSEAVSLHPVYIIIAVLIFGGLWGFWGIFFAIPLATLVKALFNAWSDNAPHVHNTSEKDA
jgi:putative permease